MSGLVLPLRRRAALFLGAAGIENAAAECDWLLCAALERSQTQMLLTQSVTAREQERFNELLSRRAAGEPVQYLLGEWEFCGLPYYVGEGVLIPRPETELLAQEAVRLAAKKQSPVVLDLCAGTGCIGLTIAKRLPEARVFLVEKSPQALEYLLRNRLRLGAENAVVIHGDVLTGEGLELLPAADLLCANPPYIPTGELESLQREVKAEPPLALDGGEDGLLFYRAIAELAAKMPKPPPALLLELGDGQYGAAAPLFGQLGYAVGVIEDDGGHKRVLCCNKL
jgi:release factor glutamine methyltransferase